MTTAEKLVTVAENQPRVYDAGYDKAVGDYSKAQACNPLNGSRLTDLRYKFSGYGWNDETFSFANSVYSIDGLAITYALNTFSFCYITDIDLFLDLSNATSINYAFSNCTRLRRIKRIKFPNSATATTTPFNSCSALEEITVEGEISFTLSFQWCSKLKPASMKSIIAALVNYAGTDKEYTYQVRFHADCWTVLESDSTAPDGGTWKDHVKSLGWNT